MIKTILKLVIALFLCITNINNISAQEAYKTKVLISKVIDHAALDSTVMGIVDTLKKNGFEKDKNLNLEVDSAQGSISLASQIASKYISQDPDIVVGVGTLSAQSFIKSTKSERPIRLIFSSVTDPEGANLTNMKNISGVSNFVSLKEQLELFKKLQPDLKKLGVLYNASESNSAFIINKLKQLCPDFGIELVDQTITKTADINQALNRIIDKIDAIFISNDNTALASMPNIVKIANSNKIPVYVSDTDAINSGALAALGPDQYQIGVQTGQMIVDILNGKDINEIKIEFPKKSEVYINEKTAKFLELQIPQEISSIAKIIRQSND